MSGVFEFAKAARNASFTMAGLSAPRKDAALQAIAQSLIAHKDIIEEENRKDIAQATLSGLAAPLLKRLLFDANKIYSVVEGINSLISLPDPVGKTLLGTKMDDGLSLYRVSCPIGVIGIIFESRPDALVQIASLCLKAGNAVLLKGGSEAAHTNRILADVIEEASISAGVPKGWISLLESRSDVEEMLKLDEYIDLIIPRGSNAFVQYIMQHSSIPVLGHADGVCHVYVHEKADPDMAVRLVLDSKTQYVAVCNAAETLIIDESVASSLLPVIAAALEEKHVVLHGDERASAIWPMDRVDEWHHEYLDYEMSVRIVRDVSEAIAHINQYGSGHTDAIITADEETAQRFMQAVDSGSVMWNCSTRFSDGYKYGFGAEVGISTSKIHARGPVGLEGLVTYKYKVFGNGQTVEDYASGKKHFVHTPIPLPDGK
jgi:glutamate-5-semialdehyde dehydrogenase